MSLRKYSLLLPGSYHYLAASCFTIFNQPEVVAPLFTSVLETLAIESRKAGHERAALKAAELHLARQFRESLLRAGIFGGMSKAINSLQELHKVMPEELQETISHKEPVAKDSALQTQGRKFLQDVYGPDQSTSIENALYNISPRLGLYSVSLVYGGVYADTTALSTHEACVLMYLCNMAVDTPKQAIGHIDSSRRQGASKQELLDVGIMVRTIAEMYSVKLKHWEQIMETVDLDKATASNPYTT